MLVNLRALLVRLIDIILLRGGPEQLPASPSLLGLIVALNVGVSALIYSLLPVAPEQWFLQLVVGTVVELLCFRAAFTLANKPERFLQTSTAIFGVVMLFAPALIPITTELQPYVLNPDPKLPPPTGLTLLGTVIGLWVLVVQVRIIRAAFEWHFVVALLFLIGMTFASAFVYGMLFRISLNSG